MQQIMPQSINVNPVDKLGNPIAVGNIVAYSLESCDQLVGAVTQILATKIKVALDEVHPNVEWRRSHEIFPEHIICIDGIASAAHHARAAEGIKKEVDHTSPSDKSQITRYICQEVRADGSTERMIGVFKFFGTTVEDMERLITHLKKNCGVSLVGKFLTSEPFRQTRWGGNLPTPPSPVAHWSQTLGTHAGRTFSKRKFDEFGLQDCIDAIMTIEEFNDIVHPDFQFTGNP